MNNNKYAINKVMSRYSSRRKFLYTAALAGITAGGLPAELMAGDSLTDDKKIPREKGFTFLFQGDSITDGNRGRNADPNHIMGHGYAFAVTARIGADFPASGYTFYNRGISGNTIPDLQKRWQTDSIDLKPDILSILIGINDAAAFVDKKPGAHSPEEFETGYKDLLQKSRAANPDLLVVLGLPFVYGVGKRKENWETWQTATLQRAGAVRKLAGEFDAVLIDYPTLFDKAISKAPADYWIWDGIHPTVFGHELMAREWIKQVGARLRFLHRKYKY